MAVLPSYSATLADLAAQMDPDGRLSLVVDMLSQENAILEDIPWIECNDGTANITTIRTGLPQVAYRILNYGVPYGKSTTAQITDKTGMLAAFSRVDKTLVERAGANGAAFRLNESMTFLEAMSQQMASDVFYGNASVYPERFTGLAPRFSTVNPANANNAVNVIDAGGTGSTNTSIWIVNWGPTTVHGLYPKGSRAGLVHQDVTGDQPVYDLNGNPYMAYQDRYEWHVGMTVRDWRQVVRIANIDASLLTGSNAADLISLLKAAVYKFPVTSSGVSSVQKATKPSGIVPGFKKTIIYCNRATSLALDMQGSRVPNLLLRYDEIDGHPQMKFRGIPVKVCDAIVNTEARVV